MKLLINYVSLVYRNIISNENETMSYF